MNAEPKPQHRWLQRFLGEWTCETECSMGPDKPKEKFTSTESVRSIGDLWIAGHGEGQMPGGGTAKMLLTLGYDPSRQRFVGTWIGSMMTHLWIYEGELDSTEKVLTLNTEGPSMMAEGKLAKYRDVHQFHSDDHRTLTSYGLGEDGAWHEFMTAHYRRKR